MASAAAALTKSPEAFRTISEVAEMLDVPQHVLRFWESRFAHIKPVKRAGRRRFYRPEDVDLLRGIRTLLYHEGYTIKGVQKILREKGVRYAAEVGRADALKHGRGKKTEPPESGRGSAGFDAIATLARVHGDAAETIALDEERRTRLDALLAELLGLKSRLRDARSQVLM